MTKKTRIRVARTAAGAVIAVGASLAATGAAQAVGIGVEVAGVEIGVRTAAGPGDEDPGEDGDPCSPLDPRCEPPEPPATPPHPSGPPTGPADPSEPPTDPDDPPAGPTAPPSKPAKPSAKPTQDPAGSTGPGDGTGGTGDNGGGVGQIGVSGGGGNTDTDSVGNQPVEQGRGKDELAETGAGQTAFLLTGAVTMIAGGIGFRVLSRRTGSRTAA
ncbi:hypothetical protein LRE75_34800 [Streptomyces sp. 372A]